MLLFLSDIHIFTFFAIVCVSHDEVRRIIDIMAPGGGFVFAPVHNVQKDVSPENLWAMWDALINS